jgi:3'-phosphoadenosine 5'-phosphosulfate sulfotransferase (PAPS reductase)/FAD synthetase
VTLTTLSYGGGVQSTALLVLAATGRLAVDVAIFANVGDHAEHPATLAYVRDVAAPYAAAHGVELIQRGRGGANPDLFDRLAGPGGFLGIPVRMGVSGAPGRRSCTHDYKLVVVGRELKARGATPADPATVMVGISTDEISRANNRRALPYETVTYPLLDLRMSRTDCARTIAAAGLPVPPKSSCWFCPFHSRATWQTMRTDDPAMFDRACQLEDTLNAKRAAGGRDPVWLSSALIPLRAAVLDHATLPFDDPDPGCDSGWCMT